MPQMRHFDILMTPPSLAGNEQSIFYGPTFVCSIGDDCSSSISPEKHVLPTPKKLYQSPPPSHQATNKESSLRKLEVRNQIFVIWLIIIKARQK